MVIRHLCDCVPQAPTLHPLASVGELLPWSCLGECQGSADTVTEEHGRPTSLPLGHSGNLSRTEDSGAEDFLW